MTTTSEKLERLEALIDFINEAFTADQLASLAAVFGEASRDNELSHQYYEVMDWLYRMVCEAHENLTGVNPSDTGNRTH